MTTKVRVEYARKISEASTYQSTSYGGSVEFDIPKDAEWQAEYQAAFAVLKTIVDSQIQQVSSPSSGDVAAPPAAAAAAEPPAATAEQPVASAAAAAVVVEVPDPDELVSYSGAKVVFDPEEKQDVNGKVYITVRLDHPELPGRYRHGKSYEPDVIHVVETLRKGDRVDVSGHFERPWQDRKGQMQAALTIAEVERIKPEPAAK